MTSLTGIATSGTAKAKVRLRNTVPANSALAATGVKFGACGAKRAITSSPTRLIASASSARDRSIPRAHSARRSLAIGAIAIIFLLAS